MTAEVLRQAADLIEQRAADIPDGHLDAWRKPHIRAVLTPWVALMDPAIGVPLAAWLRAEAACLDSTADMTEHMPKLMDAIEENMTRKPARGHEVRISMSTATDAVAFANAILRETS